MVVLSATILVTIRVVGVLLISGLIVLPAVAARALTDRFGRLLWLSPALGAAMAATGMYASWFADMPSGASIVLVGSAVVAVAFAVPARPRSAGDRRARLSRSGFRTLLSGRARRHRSMTKPRGSAPCARGGGGHRPAGAAGRRRRRPP